MERLIITSSITAFILKSCAAQTRIQEGEIKAKHASYSIKESNMDFGKGHPYFILVQKTSMKTLAFQGQVKILYIFQKPIFM